MFDEKKDNQEAKNGQDSRVTPPSEPEEVVSWYEPKPAEDPEVVEYFIQPTDLPLRAQTPPPAAAPQRHSRRGLWIFLACVGVLLAVVLAAVLTGTRRTHRPPAESGLPGTGENPSSIIEIGDMNCTIPVVQGDPDVRLPITYERGPALSPQEIYQRVSPSVVTVIAEEKKELSIGTGVIMTTDGYILTNAHVISKAKSCCIVLSNDVMLEVGLVGYDKQQDLAVLKTTEEVELPAATFGNSGRTMVGDTVYAIGNPMGLELRGTMTEGMISAVGRKVNLDGNSMIMLQSTAALNAGNSGGPLINSYGQVIGINTMKMSNTDMDINGTIEGLGFSLPITDLTFAVRDLITLGYYRGMPMLGVTVFTIQTEEGITGVIVNSVVENSGADRAGVHPGDVLLQADGEDIYTTEDLLRIRSDHQVDETMHLTLWRDEEMLETDVLLHSDRKDLTD